jgi:lipopolysaccharide/colanic/teichoic acid biosynthesis glycosyltransferase
MSEPTSSATMNTVDALDAVDAVEEAPPPGPNATPSAASSLLVLPIGPGTLEDSVRALVLLPRGIPVSVRIAKRAIDVVTALVGLSIVAVLLPFLALAIWLDSPGPIFYRQARASHARWSRTRTHCRCAPFSMLKLRTMRVDAEKLTGPVLAGENDPRVTRVGRLLRRTRLDELPQFWNVLVGDMSLVGPRPERPELFENLALAIPFFEERMRDCKPGITGLAQVSLGYTGRAPADSAIARMSDSLVNPFHLPEAEGSDADDMRTKLLFDLAYVAALEHLDTFLLTELAIILKTPWVMLRGLGR